MGGEAGGGHIGFAVNLLFTVRKALDSIYDLDSIYSITLGLPSKLTARRIVLLVRNVCATGLHCIKATGTCL